MLKMDLNARRRKRVPGPFWVFVILFVQLCWCLGSVRGNVVFKVEHKFAQTGIGRSLSAYKAHDSDRHRRILSAIDVPLGGNGSPNSAALYFTKIQIGSPPKDYHVQVDTGSDLLWVNCVGCNNCPKKSDLGIPLALYDSKASSTAKTVSCDEDFCTSTFSAPTSDCKVGMLCSYSVTYGDGSSTSGYFVRDNVQLDRVSGNFQTSFMNGSVAFGCGARQSGELGSSQQALDGIIGFGQANSSMLSQLAAAKKVKKVFSHCLDGAKGGGIFAIGELVHPKVNVTPLVQHEAHYNVIIKAIEVGGDVLQLPTDIFDTGSGRGTIIDSGTTLAYFPDEVYNQLLEKVIGAQPNLKTHIVDQDFKCFKYDGNVDDAFPVVTMFFEDSLTLQVYPHQYLFEVADQEWCIGWQNSGIQGKDGRDITLLGDIALSDKLVLYDVENQTIGWTNYNCSSSIKVKDDVSGNVFSVGAHVISSSSHIADTGNVLGFMLLMATFINFIY